MTVAKLDVIEQLFDNNGLLLAGGFVYTYAGGTSTPLVTYADATGLSPNSNPVQLDAAGRCDLWFSVGVAYKVVVTTELGSVLHTVDGIEVADPTATATTSQYADLVFMYGGGPPEAATTNTPKGWIGGEKVARAINFAANFSGSYGHTFTNPTASFVMTVRKNCTKNDDGTQIGTITVATDGSYTFATTAGAIESLAAGDRIDVFAPVTADTTMANFKFTLAGTLA